jgi:hypothetical protein
VAATLTRWLSSRTPAQLAELLAARPDAATAPVPRHLGELAERLEIFHSVAAAIHQLPRPALQVIEVLQLLGPGAGSRDALAGWLGCPPDHPGLTRTLDQLTDLALVWPDGDMLPMVEPLYAAFQYPLRLSPPAAVLLARYSADQLRPIARTLGVPGATRKQDLVVAIAEWLGEADQVRALVSTADQSTRAALLQLASDGPGEDRPAVWYGTYQRPDPNLRWAAERGLVLADSWGVPQPPREVAVALRGPDWHAPFTPDRPAAALTGVDDTAVAREAAAAGSAAVEQLTTLLETIAASPVALLKAGGVGVKELRRLAKTRGLDEATVRLWLELAYEAELVAPVRQPGRAHGDSGTAQLLPTAGYDEWVATAPAERLAALLPAWAGLPAAPLAGPPDGEKPPPALLREHDGRLPVAVRHQLIGLASVLPAGRGVADQDSLVETVSWHSPLLLGAHPDAAALVSAGWREAQLVGVVAHGALSPLGRALLEAEPVRIEAACWALLPPAVEQAVFQADLTAVVPGTPDRALAELLDATADRESRGGAVTWRFTAGSVRRALDAGHAADDLVAGLRERAVGGTLPQPLAYLVTDVARRHGAVRVREVACVLRAEDPALVAELAGARALRPLRLSVVAPTVLGSAAPVAETLAALRAAGYAPVAESADGVPQLERVAPRRAGRPRQHRPEPRGPARPAAAPVDPRALAEKLLAAPIPAQRLRPDLREPDQPELIIVPPDGEDEFGFEEPDLAVELEALASHLAPGERRLLAHAIETGEPVTISYTNQQGNGSTRVIDSAELDGTHLLAWCHLRDDERMFALHRIGSVAPA